MSEYLPDPISFSDDRYGRVISLLFFWNEGLIIMITFWKIFSHFTFFLNSTENIVFVLSTFILWEKNWQLIGTTFHLTVGAIWSWLYGSWSYNYLCNQYLSPLSWIQTPLRRGVLDTTLCDNVCHWLAEGLWFSSGPLVSSNNKTDHHNIIEILLKVA